MKAVDTNVLARLILQDDERQALAAQEVMSGPTWVSNSVWIELGWVLEKRLRLDRDVVSDALASVLAIDTLHTADRNGLLWAIDRYRRGADWADMVHLFAARGVADTFVTFDYGVSRHAADAPIDIETLT